MTPASPAPSTDTKHSSRDAKAIRLRVRVTGVVQGVGFRPFIYRIADRFGVAGCVRNTSGGAELELEAVPSSIDAFLQELRLRPPPIARIDQIETEPMQPLGETGFRIISSLATSEQAALVSPDVSVCDDCLRELRDPNDRRYGYPFVNCTNCGPRFTIVQEVPYDRPKTTMASFPLCEPCAREYADPLDRRYHAQPVACPSCGPAVALLAPDGALLASGSDAVKAAREMLSSGRILAIKGLGGFHLACDAANGEAVQSLRDRKPRPHKPLAIMCRDLATVRAHCELSEAEERELTHPRRPILLLARSLPSAPEGRHSPAQGNALGTADEKMDAPQRGATGVVAPAVAPGHRDLGVMLPYTPLHALLIDPGAPSCLVMTSGNRTGGPIEISNDDALRILGPIADAVLVHDRDIWNRCDDSVASVRGDQLVMMRRSRGFVPLPIEVDAQLRPTFAVGAMFANAFAIAKGRRVFLSQHIGDVDDVTVLQFLEESYGKLKRWLGIEPELVVHDLHPDLLTTHLARRMAAHARTVAVQHHHAHLASAMAAAGIDGEVQGIVFDGTGYGLDGAIWGGELLVGNAARVRRAGHLRELLLPGGDAATKRPLRIAAAWLHQLVPHASQLPLELWSRAEADEVQVIRRMVDRRFNAARTTSAGRLFDAVSAMLAVCDQVSYEGQAAIELEQFARDADVLEVGRMAVVEEMGRVTIDPSPWFSGAVAALAAGKDRSAIARDFHYSLACGTAEACARVANGGGPRRVVACGGVFQNRMLASMIALELERRGMQAVLPGQVPVNDGGLALGQVMVAHAASPARVDGTAVGWEE